MHREGVLHSRLDIYRFWQDKALSNIIRSHSWAFFKKEDLSTLSRGEYFLVLISVKQWRWHGKKVQLQLDFFFPFTLRRVSLHTGAARWCPKEEFVPVGCGLEAPTPKRDVPPDAASCSSQREQKKLCLDVKPWNFQNIFLWHLWVLLREEGMSQIIMRGKLALSRDLYHAVCYSLWCRRLLTFFHEAG